MDVVLELSETLIDAGTEFLRGLPHLVYMLQIVLPVWMLDNNFYGTLICMFITGPARGKLRRHLVGLKPCKNWLGGAKIVILEGNW